MLRTTTDVPKINVDLTDAGFRETCISALEQFTARGSATDVDASFLRTMAVLHVGDQLARIAEALEARDA